MEIILNKRNCEFMIIGDLLKYSSKNLSIHIRHPHSTVTQNRHLDVKKFMFLFLFV